MATYSELENYLKSKSTPDDIIDGEYIGITKLAMGFCIYKLSTCDYEKFRIENKLRKAGLLKNNKSMDVRSTCLYDDPKIDSVSYITKVKDLANVKWFHVPDGVVSEHNFLKSIYENNGARNAAIGIELRHNDYGLDESELRELSEEEKTPDEYDFERDLFDSDESD